MVDEVAKRSQTKGIIIMPTIVSNHLEVGGVKSAPETGKERPRRTASIVDGKVTERASVGRSVPIQTNQDPDPVELNKEIGSGHTMPRALKEPEMYWARPS